jgi:hypothetical protein
MSTAKRAIAVLRLQRQLCLLVCLLSGSHVDNMLCAQSDQVYVLKIAMIDANAAALFLKICEK